MRWLALAAAAAWDWPSWRSFAWQQRVASAGGAAGATGLTPSEALGGGLDETPPEEDPCADPGLGAQERREHCESAYRHDGPWPALAWQAPGSVQAYLLTYALLPPAMLADLLGGMAALAGVQIVHTALAYCQGSTAQTEAAERFQTWCSSAHAADPQACWTSQQGVSPCGSGADDCSINLADLRALDCKEFGFFEGWGVDVQQGKPLSFDLFNDTSPQVFWLGAVDPAEVNSAVQQVVSCPGGDFNPGTYDAAAHNCHAFVEAVMSSQGLPVWASEHALPAAMAPEEQPGMLGDVINGWVGEGNWSGSPDCAAQASR